MNHDGYFAGAGFEQFAADSDEISDVQAGEDVNGLVGRLGLLQIRLDSSGGIADVEERSFAVSSYGGDAAGTGYLAAFALLVEQLVGFRRRVGPLVPAAKRLESQFPQARGLFQPFRECLVHAATPFVSKT